MVDKNYFGNSISCQWYRDMRIDEKLFFLKIPIGIFIPLLDNIYYGEERVVD